MLWGFYSTKTGTRQEDLTLSACTDDLSLEQVDERTVSLGQSGLTETNKSPLVMFTALAFSTDILSIYQVGQDWRIDLAGAEALVQLATSFISKEQVLFNLPRKDFEETKTEAKESWENLLGRLDVVETGSVDRTFFDHCLYRLFSSHKPSMR